MIQLHSRVERYAISIPQQPSDIPAQYFAGVTEGINLPEHYAIIAVVRQTRFYDFMLTLTNPKAKVRATDIAVLAKINSDKVPQEWAVGQQVIIDESAIARGTQIVLPCALAYENLVSYFLREEQAIASSKDQDVRKLVPMSKAISTGEAKDDKGVPVKEYPMCFLSFKIVPVTDIHGTADGQTQFQDPFVTVDEEKKDEKSSEEETPTDVAPVESDDEKQED